MSLQCSVSIRDVLLCSRKVFIIQQFPPALFPFFALLERNEKKRQQMRENLLTDPRIFFLPSLPTQLKNAERLLLMKNLFLHHLPSFSSGRRITHEIIIKNKTVAWPGSMIYEILEFSDRLGTCFRPNLPNRLENLWTYFWNIGRYVNLVGRFMIITLSTVSIYKLEWIVSLNIEVSFMSLIFLNYIPQVIICDINANFSYQWLFNLNRQK